MAICVSLRSASTIPIDFTGLTPKWTQDKSLGEIEKRKVFHGRHQIRLAEICRVSGDPSDGRMEFDGDFSLAHGIGAAMTLGSIHVSSNAGCNVGLGMQGGKIHVKGAVGDFLGCEMRGGTIRVDGSAGNSVGGAQNGSRRGMTGGTILIQGNAGDHVGHLMRRGLIAVRGNAGKFLGYNMLAGTIVVLGTCNSYAGAGMKRGTLILLGKSQPVLLPTFRLAGKTASPVLPLTGRHLKSVGFIENTARFAEPCELLHGDFLALGKGELFLSN